MKVIISRISNRLSVSAFIGENVSDIGISVKSVIGAPLVHAHCNFNFQYNYVVVVTCLY